MLTIEPGRPASCISRSPDTLTSLERIRHARMMGCASGVKGLLGNSPECFDELRATWPELAERVDRICELVDWASDVVARL